MDDMLPSVIHCVLTSNYKDSFTAFFEKLEKNLSYNFFKKSQFLEAPRAQIDLNSCYLHPF